MTSLAEDSTRSYTCSMYSEGTSISRLITPENAATLRMRRGWPPGPV
ncbi:hypothetical protein P4056_28325 [Pseudomonas aeruginosa]|nr:hypothetical protein [Pseudomonas aeruginosa]